MLQQDLGKLTLYLEKHKRFEIQATGCHKEHQTFSLTKNSVGQYDIEVIGYLEYEAYDYRNALYVFRLHSIEIYGEFRLIEEEITMTPQGVDLMISQGYFNHMTHKE